MNPEDRHYLIARSLFLEANDAFFLFDPESLAVADLNPAALRLLGLEKKAALRLRLTDLFSGRSRDGLERLVLALERTGFFHSREGYDLTAPSGEVIPVNLSVSRIHLEAETVGLVVARDIRDHRRAEEALRQAEARYNSFIELTGVVVWENDLQGRLRSISPSFEEITGWAPAEWIGRPFDELVHPDDRAEARRLHARAVGGEALPRFELRVLGRDGRVIDGEFLLVTKVQGTRDDRTLGIARDITEQKCAQRALEQAASLEKAKEEAERANRAKSEFLSRVSHDLRTPLSAVLGFADLMAEHPSLDGAPPELRDWLATIRSNGQLLVSLIDDLLDISRIELGQLRLERTPCSLARIISGVVDSLRTRFLAGPVSISVRLAPNVPETIVGDQLRIRQIVMNLVDNAIKFTRRGTIKVAAELEDRPGAGPLLRLAVSDTGIGMSEEEQARLFQPFCPVRRVEPGARSGTGLGLAICQRLATRMGGELAVTSRPGVGSTFTLTVPVGTEVIADQERSGGSPARAEVGHATARPATRGARVLLAEDHDENRKVLSTRLARAGCEVCQARNGQEALDQIRESADLGRPFQAVIMDMEMPVLDGYEAVRRLRADGFDAPILAVTAFAMRQDREECLRMGCDEYVSKPVVWDVFFQKLDRLLASRGRG
ncbi:MAG: PAS domain S-box protein [Isosphaeraceae bacterium]